MPRIARQVDVGGSHHVTLRTLKGLAMFGSNADRKAFLAHVRLVAKEEGVTILSWSLMVNHYHLVVVPHHAAALARMMKRVNHRLSRAINKRYDRTGPAFDSRYYSCPMDESHAVASFRYVNRNPVRTRLVSEACDYRWSSARYLLGLEAADQLVQTRNPFDMTLDWTDLLRSDPDEVEAIRASTHSGRPLRRHPPTGAPPEAVISGAG